MENYSNTLIISGVIGSGKTTLSKKIASELNGTYVSFGDYIRHIANQKQIPPTRQNLQNLGRELINLFGYKKFVSKVFDYHINTMNNSNIIIVDGVRHVAVYEIIKEVSENCWLLFIDIPVNQLFENIIIRDNLKKQDVSQMMKHSAEGEIKNLALFANYTISKRPIENWDMITSILKEIKNTIDEQK